MSFLVAAPQALAHAASDLADLGSTINTATAAAAAPTTALVPAAADDVSAAIAALFSAHGQGYQRLSAQVAAFHEQFVQSLTASASTYAAAEANAVQTLLNAVNAPAQAVLGHPLIGGGAGNAGGVVSNAVGRAESVLLGNGGTGLIGGGSGLLGGGGGAIGQAVRSALLLAPTGGASGVAGALPRLLSSMTNAAGAPAAFGSIATAIENAYLFVEPYVQYGFELLAWAAGYVLPFGLANQINIFYNLIEPIVQSGLFNILDWLSGMISFSQGLHNFFAATASSINYFIQTEINWFRGFLPPLPPLPPLP